MPSAALLKSRSRVSPYVQIARVDHWFKNSFMLGGLLLAAFYRPEAVTWHATGLLLLALGATCFVASSNYVINELLDGRQDALHPLKGNRPVPAGLIDAKVATIEWLGLGLAGLALSTLVNRYVALAAVALWLMGLVYNVPPLRTKEWPYLDVLSESANNAIRLLLGWFAIVPDRFPPLSLTLAYWMAGAFFMGAKRLAEYREIADPAVAAAYRRSFGHYNEERLLISLFFYATASALFTGIFIVRFHVELVLFVPVAAMLFAYYFRLALQPGSPVQTPEALYRDRRFLIYATVSVALFVLLLFIRIPALYDWFNIDLATDRVAPLWTLEPGNR